MPSWLSEGRDHALHECARSLYTRDTLVIFSDHLCMKLRVPC